MKTFQLRRILLVLAAFLGPLVPERHEANGQTAPPRAGQGDSYKYYGPGGLSEYWHKTENKDAALQRLGRDTWIHWTWGNQKTLRRASILAGNLPVPVSIDLFRLLDSRKRKDRFRELGLINEPNCKSSDKPDRYGLWLDTFEGDPPYEGYPNGYYPVDKEGNPNEQYVAAYYPKMARKIEMQHFGRPSGVVGVRLFKNPQFKEDAETYKEWKWDRDGYFKNPGKVEPPYLVGFSSAFCHIAFDPKNPPENPEKPRWENLAANIGNQYLREGEIFFGKGRIVFGDKNPPDPKDPDKEPYKTKGLTEQDFLYQYAVTQQPGTSETSRFSYDFINNPNTINPLFGLKYRPKFEEHTPWGLARKYDGTDRERDDPKTYDPRKDGRVWHALKDGADAVGIEWAIMRVPLNIGCEGDYWIDQLFNPASGRKQRPVHIADVLAGLSPEELAAAEKASGLQFGSSSRDEQTRQEAKARQAELRERYRSPYGKEEFGEDWQEAWRRVPALLAYLTSYGPAHLKDARPADPTDAKAAKVARAAIESRDNPGRKRGARLFGLHCAECHSSKQPYTKWDLEDPKRFFEISAQQAGFLQGNFLSNERRYSVKELGTNMARALGTNAVDADIWAEFSSPEYKAQRPIGLRVLDVPVFGKDKPESLQKTIRVEFDPPGGGRGYYRTPSLISLWATAPYLHNNSVGDYFVIKDDGSKDFFPNNGTRIGRKIGDTWVDYTIDVSVAGRLKMFEDGMKKLLNPSQRRGWVKRTTQDSSLIPDLPRAIQQAIAAVARGVLRKELGKWVRDHPDLPLPPVTILQAVDAAFEQAVRQDLKELAQPLKLGLAVLQQQTRDHAGRLFEMTFDNVLAVLGDKYKDTIPYLVKLKPLLRRAFLEQLESVDRQVHDSLSLKAPKGWPINLYANLNAAALPHALLAQARLHDDPLALAQALLQLSDCPDLEEDTGHKYGKDLTDSEKEDLIEFLKTF